MFRISLIFGVFLLTLLVAADASPGCTDCDGDGYAWPVDCNDADAGSHPGATETCDGFDNDCDGLVDNDPPCDNTCDTPAQIGVDLRLTDEAAISAAPSVAWNGGGYAVAWADRRFGIYDQIYFTRLNGLGVKLEPEVPITFTSTYSVQPALVWTGTEYGLVFARDGELYFARIDSAGNKVGLDVQVTTLGNPAQLPDLVWTGSEYGVVWRDSRDGNDEIYFARLDDAGTKIGSDVRVTSDTGQSDAPRLVWAGGEFGVAWDDDRDGNEEIYFARLDAAGTKLTADIRVTSDADISVTPDLAWTGSEYGVVWRDRRDGNGEIYFALLTAAGVQVGSDVRVTDFAGNSGVPRLQWTGGEYGVSWRDRRDGNNEIYFAHLDSLGLKIGSDLRVTSDANESTEPAMIWTGSAFGIAWTDDRDGNQEIYFSRVSCACGPDLDSDGYTACDGDCDDDDADTYPGASEVCDGFNNNCDDPLWPTVPGDEIDTDGDTFWLCAGDCSEYNGQVYPGAPEICDGVNNDCDHPNWPSLAGTIDGDNDGDGLSVCAGDCDDTSDCTYPGAAPADSAGACMKDCDLDEYGDVAPPGGVVPGSDCADDSATTYPGAPPVYCDHSNNDCSDPTWPAQPPDESDDDGDGLAECAGDCDDAESAVYPAAPQICDGLNNDCDHPSWPALTGTEEVEDWDGDSYTGCQNDCDILDPATNPDGVEICDGRDNDCDGEIDGLPGCDNVCDEADRLLPEVRVTQKPGWSRYPSMITTGAGFAVAWSDRRDLNTEIYFALLDQTGHKIGDDHRITEDTESSSHPDLAWTGTEFGVTWTDTRDTLVYYREQIYFARISPGGEKIGPDIRITDHGADTSVPDLVWTGSEYGLTWYDNRAGDRAIYFVRLDPTGAKIGEDLLVSPGSGYAWGPSVAWTGSHYAVAWYDYVDFGNYEIFLSLVDVQGNLVSVLRITDADDDSELPELVWTGTELGLFWSDNRDGQFELYFTRLDDQGARLSGDLRLTDNGELLYSMEAVWTGEEYAVTWADDRDGDSEAYLLRVDPAGIPLGPDFRVSEAGGARPTLAWNGSIYGTLWSGASGETDNSELYFTQVICGCPDGDGDGESSCGDCDDGHPDVYPGAPQICDGLNNDCNHPNWPMVANTNDSDDDGDGLTECAGDCDDALATVRPGLTEVCDFLDNDCNGQVDDGLDADGDGLTTCAGDCDDSRADVYPGAPQICDGINNDCNHPSWPALEGTDEVEDRDGDGVTGCAGDCDVLNPATYPGAAEICDGLDNDCDGQVDEGLACTVSCPAPGGLYPDLPVADSPESASYPFLVTTDMGHGVAWADTRNGPHEIYFNRLDPVGAPVGAPLRVTYSSEFATFPAMAWTGSEYGITWTEFPRTHDDDGEIYFARVSAAGAKMGSEIRITSDPGSSIYPSIAWSGSGYGVAWQERGEVEHSVYFARLDPAGFLQGEAIQLTSTASFLNQPDVVWTGSRYAVAWDDERDGLPEIYLALVDALGSVSGPLRITNDPANSSEPRLAWTGAELGLLWRDDRDASWELYFARLDEAGSRLSGDIPLTANAVITQSPRLAWSGGEYGVAWQDARGNNEQIYFMRLDQAGTKISAELRISQSPTASGYPGLAWAGSAYGTVWQDTVTGGHEIRFTRIECDCLDGDGDGYTSCSDCDDAEPQIFPQAEEVCDGLNNNCLHPSWPALTGTDEVEDRDGDGLTGCEGDCDVLNPDTYPGATEVCDGRDNTCDGLIDESLSCPLSCADADKELPHVLVSDDPGNALDPSLVYTGSGFAMAWYDHKPGQYEIYFAELDETGSPVGEQRRVTYSSGVAAYPRMVWTGSGFGLAWMGSRDGDFGPPYDLYFARLDADGNRIGEEFQVSTGVTAYGLPDLVWTGTEYGVAWVDGRNDASEIFFARLDATGQRVGGEIRITTGALGNSMQPAIGWTGSHYVLAWESGDLDDRDIYAILFEPGGGLPSPTRITDEYGRSQGAELVWTGSEIILVWADNRSGSDELYMIRLDGSGTPLSAETRLTVGANASLPSLSFTGGEIGVAWREYQGWASPIYFARFDLAGTQLIPGLKVSELETPAYDARVVWTGEAYGVAWQGRLGHTGYYGAYFSRIRCDCLDGDGDGYTACSDCDDGHPDVYPHAENICDGLNNDCLDAAWPDLAGTDDGDDDGDGFSECQGDCLDANPAVAPGASQVCDGANNDCLDAAWPALTGTNEASADGDAYSECGGDCDETDGGVYPFAPQVCDGLNNDCLDAAWPTVAGTNEDDVDGDGLAECAGDNCPFTANSGQENGDGDPAGDACDCRAGDPDIWAPPGEALNLMVFKDSLTVATALEWDIPDMPGTTLPLTYDLLRSPDPADFATSGTCLESDDGSDRFAIDWEMPAPGAIFYYLVRSDGACPGAAGSLGTGSDGTPRSGRLCP